MRNAMKEATVRADVLKGMAENVRFLEEFSRSRKEAELPSLLDERGWHGHNVYSGAQRVYNCFFPDDHLHHAVKINIANFAGAFEEHNSSVELDALEQIASFYEAIPESSYDALFQEFHEAAEARDLQTLVDTITGWAATGELLANPQLAEEVRKAIGGRKEIAEWLSGW